MPSTSVWPSNSWTARMLPVFRYIFAAFVRQSVCVPYPLGSRPIAVTQSQTSRPYWRVEMCGRSWNRLGNMKRHANNSGNLTQAKTVSRVFTVGSNWTGRLVFLRLGSLVELAEPDWCATIRFVKTSAIVDEAASVSVITDLPANDHSKHSFAYLGSTTKRLCFH